MQKLFAFATTALFLISMAPGAMAHTATAPYDIASSPARMDVAGEQVWGVAVSTRLCASEWDQWDEDDEYEDLIVDGDGLDWVAEAAWDTTVGTTCSTARDVRGEDAALFMGVFSAGIEAAEDNYFSHVMTVSDDNFDATFSTFCVFTGVDNWCDEDDVETEGCGSLSVETATPAGGPEHGPSVFLFGAFLNGDTLETCFATQGEVTYVAS